MRKTLLLLVVMAAGCGIAPTDETGRVDLPFKEYIAPDGARTWSIYFDERNDRHHGDQTDEELIARQMAWSRFCENGYAIVLSEPTERGRMYYGSCR